MNELFCSYAAHGFPNNQDIDLGHQLLNGVLHGLWVRRHEAIEHIDVATVKVT